MVDYYKINDLPVETSKTAPGCVRKWTWSGGSGLASQYQTDVSRPSV